MLPAWSQWAFRLGTPATCSVAFFLKFKLKGLSEEQALVSEGWQYSFLGTGPETRGAGY